MQKLAAEFVPAADASDRLQNKSSKDEDALLFQKFAAKWTMREQRGGTGQGQYVVTPSGELLASCATTSPKVVAEMMKKGLEQWGKLPRAKRLLPNAPDPKAAERWRRWEKLYPENGLVLHVVSRDQTRVRWPDWNQDYAWFRTEEARAFVPAEPKQDAEHKVPLQLVERLARFHLLDNVYALNYTFFPKEAIEKAGLTAVVIQVEGDLVSLRFEGETRASLLAPQKLGYEPKLLGRAKYNLKNQKFVSFELVAVGMRWGLGNCNQRHDPSPAPMGIVFKLAGKSPAERLPPAFISRYGW